MMVSMMPVRSRCDAGAENKRCGVVRRRCDRDVIAVFPLYKGEQIKTFFMIYIFTLFNKYNFKEKSKLFFIYLSKYLFYVIWYKYIK